MYRMGEEEIEEVRRVIESKLLFRVPGGEGHLQECNQFEREWAEMIGTKHALLMSGGGTAALMAALVGLQIGPGDEVLVPAYTWMATATAVLGVGAIPVLCDIDETLGIDPDDVERKITPETRAIIPVHMVGRMADMDRLLAIAKKHGLKVIEDACQANGGSYKGRRLGSLGDAGAFSFNWYKIISCGEGGALTTDDRVLFDRAVVYHDSGTTFRPFAKELSVPVFVGLQLRANEIMGAIMRIQLQRLDGILADLRRVKKMFEEGLADVRGLRFAPNNDPEGDCGVAVTFQFDTEAQARAFAGGSGVEGWLPIDSDKHVYTNWEPVLEKRIGHCPDMNPFNHPKNQRLRMNYTKDMCKRTLDIISRTVFVNPNPDWSEEEAMRKIAACRAAVPPASV